MRAERNHNVLNYILLIIVCLFVPLLSLMAAHDDKKPAPSKEKKSSTPKKLVREAVQMLIKLQEEDGGWPYDVISEGYRVGGTAIVAETLLFAAPDDEHAQEAVQRALTYLLEKLDLPDMASTGDNGQRVWGQGYALDFLCHLRARKKAGEQAKEVDKWIASLVQTLIEEALPDGGWTYYGDRPMAILTAPVTQALLLARAQGEKVPDDVFSRARKSLEKARSEEGAFAYSGDAGSGSPIDSLPGSAARSAICEVTLVLLGGGSIDAVRSALNNFHKYWDKLDERRHQNGGGFHGGDYNIASYFFNYGHRYAAQAIQMLPKKERAAERKKLLKRIVQTREEDGVWQDSVMAGSRYYGTAVMVQALLGDKTPLPPKLAKK